MYKIKKRISGWDCWGLYAYSVYLLSNRNFANVACVAIFVADKLDIPFIYFAIKPLKRGLKKAATHMNIPFENIGVVGDQIFTDVLGANRLKMYSILVEPISDKDIWVTRFNRKFEKIIKKKISK